MDDIKAKLALCGPSGAGKSYIAALLEREFHYAHVNTGEICRKLSRTVLGSESRDNLNKVSEAIRSVDNEFFVRSALAQLCDQEAVPQGVVFDSARYDSDFVYLKTRGFKILYVYSSKQEAINRLRNRGQSFSMQDFSHESETSYLKHPYDFNINNSGAGEDALLLDLKEIAARAVL